MQAATAAPKARMEDMLSIVSFVLAILVLLGLPSYRETQHEIVLAVFVLLPWLTVALVWRFPGRLSISSGTFSRDRSGGLGWPWWLAAVVSFRLCPYMAVVRPWSAVLPGVALGVLLYAAAHFVDPALRSHSSRFIRLGLLGSAVCWGHATVIEVNAVLDRSPAKVHEVAVSSKAWSVMGGGRLTVGSWGQERAVRTVEVPFDVYDSTKHGGPVCMVQYEGRLGLTWYTAQACPWNGQKVLLGRKM